RSPAAAAERPAANASPPGESPSEERPGTWAGPSTGDVADGVGPAAPRRAGWRPTRSWRGPAGGSQHVGLAVGVFRHQRTALGRPPVHAALHVHRVPTVGVQV